MEIEKLLDDLKKDNTLHPHEKVTIAESWIDKLDLFLSNAMLNIDDMKKYSEIKSKLISFISDIRTT